MGAGMTRPAAVTDVYQPRMGCHCVPAYLIECAEACLSDAIADALDATLFWYAANPFPEGRKRQAAKWRELRLEAARKLIWC
jgi:hypothetical protein